MYREIVDCFVLIIGRTDMHITEKIHMNRLMSLHVNPKFKRNQLNKIRLRSHVICNHDSKLPAQDQTQGLLDQIQLAEYLPCQ